MFNKIKTLCILASTNLINFVWATDCDAYGGVEVINGIPQISSNYLTCTSTSNSFQDKAETTLENLTLKHDFIAIAGVIICVISLIIGAVELAMSAGNQQNKQKAMKRIQISLIAIAAIGGMTVLAGIVFNLFS